MIGFAGHPFFLHQIQHTDHTHSCDVICLFLNDLLVLLTYHTLINLVVMLYKAAKQTAVYEEKNQPAKMN